MALSPATRRETILELVKSLRFERPETGDGLRHAFMGKLAFQEFWETEATRLLTRRLAAEARLATPRLARSDKAAIAGLVVETVKARLLDPASFKLPQPPRGSLADCIATPDKSALADRLWADFLAAAEPTVETWLTLHPLPRLTLAVPAARFGNVRLIASHDRAAWQELEGRFPALAGFAPDVGIFQAESAVHNFNVQPETWLVAENAGTATTARRHAEQDFSVVIALIFALSKTPGRFLRSGSDPVVRALHLSERRAATPGVVQVTTIAEILPPLRIPVRFEAGVEAAIGAWFALRALAPTRAIRASSAAVSYHQGRLAEDRERFLAFFNTLDSLFGAPLQIKKQLELAVRKLFPDEPSWLERVPRLHDLRNLLVYGGIAHLDDWSDEDDYLAKYQTTALDDVTTLATEALVRYFDLTTQ